MARVAGLTAALAWLAACNFTAPGGTGQGSDAAVDPDAAEPDAAVPDAMRAFDPALDCPDTYTVQLASTMATSRYRVIGDLQSFWDHNAACNSHRPGVTHAAVLGTMQEAMQLKAHLDNTSVYDRFYIGGVQDPAATDANEGWLGFDGMGLLPTAWHTPEGEPNDNNGLGNELHREQLLVFDRDDPYFHDAGGALLNGVVCECDGQPVAAAAQGFIDGDPNNPN
jgi:hypothetical protein